MNYMYARIDVNLPSNRQPAQPKEKPKSPIPIVSKISGAVLGSVAVANSMVGSYTGNKVRQSNIASGLQLAGIGVGVITGMITGHPLLAITGAIGTLAKSVADRRIEIVNARQEARYNRSYLGNITTRDRKSVV